MTPCSPKIADILHEERPATKAGPFFAKNPLRL
jgi:hypothetical protein